MKRFATLILTIFLLSSTVTAVSFSDTNPISDTDPNSLSDHIRIETQYEQNTSATEKRNSVAGYEVILNTQKTGNKTVFIDRSYMSVFQNNNVYLFVNGHRASYETVNTSFGTYIKFDTKKKNVRIVFRPAGLVGETNGNILEKMRLIFLDQPITILFIGGFSILLVGSGIAYFVRKRTAHVRWSTQ